MQGTPSSSHELCSDAKEMYQKLVPNVKSVSKTCDVPFNEPLYKVGAAHRRNYRKNRCCSLLFFSEQLCNCTICQFKVCAAESRGHEFPSWCAVIDGEFEDSLTLGFSVLQFGACYELLRGEIKYLVDPTMEVNLLLSHDPPFQKSTIFEIEEKALHTVRVWLLLFWTCKWALWRIYLLKTGTPASDGRGYQDLRCSRV